MTTIPVIWLNLAENSIPRGFWDQGLLERLFRGELYRTRYAYEHHEVGPDSEWPQLDGGGAIVVMPGSYHAERVNEIDALLARLAWVLLIVTSDEESLFPISQLQHPRLIVWVEPNPELRYDPAVRFLGVTCRDDTAHLLEPHAIVMGERPADVFFAGQITHERRRLMYSALEELAADPELNVNLLATEGFTQGFSRDDYMRFMAEAKIIPCPSGPAIVDTFRFWEALEAGAIPIADARCEGKPEGYWHILFGGEPPFPILDDWRALPQIARPLIESWPREANRIQAWWQRWRRDLVGRIEADVDALRDAGTEPELADLITVIVPTSPIHSHPALDVLNETLDSLEARLPGCEVIVVADGVRPEQEHLRERYGEYLRAMMRSLAFGQHNAVPLLLDEWGHQANATRAALALVRTPLVLFVEHDCPLVGEIPFAQLAEVILAGEANVIRFSHEASILEPYQHLMLDEEPRDILGVPLVATVQWSQRPHLALTTFYRQIIRRYFGVESRTMIEDVMHGVVQRAHVDGGWGMFRLFIYTPPGDIKRSTTSDGRGDEPKFEMVMEYDEEQPEWAPRASSLRALDAQQRDDGGDGVGAAGVDLESDREPLDGPDRLEEGVAVGDGDAG
jgi:hypothetical protein